MLVKSTVLSVGFSAIVIGLSMLINNPTSAIVKDSTTKNENTVDAMAKDNKIDDNNIKDNIVNNNIKDGVEVLTDLNKDKLLGNRYIVIKKPSNKNADISVENLYMDKLIVVTFSGISANEYNINSIERHNTGGTIYTGVPNKTEDFANSLKVENTDSTAKIEVGVPKIFAEFLYQDEENYYIALKKPSDVYDKIVVIDAGHGGVDGGSANFSETIYEKDVIFDIFKNLQQLLEKNDNIKAYYTRSIDVKRFLDERVALPNEIEADYFISIHCNHFDTSEAYGTEIYYGSNNEEARSKAKEFAQLMQNELINMTGLRDRGIKDGQSLYVIREANMPSILIETGFMTNDNDLAYLRSEKGKKDIAEGIYNIILEQYGLSKENDISNSTSSAITASRNTLSSNN